jgi:hypothetical protein
MGTLLTLHKNELRSQVGPPLLYIIKLSGLSANVQAKAMVVCILVPCHKMLLFWKLSPFRNGQSKIGTASSFGNLPGLDSRINPPS